MPFGPLVSGDWLVEHTGLVRVVDVRWYLDGRSGRAAYRAGHLPGAVWLDVDTELSGPASPQAGRHPLPTPQRFAAALGRVGIHARDRVVAYDDTGGSTAARLWYLLRVLGRPVAVLDGGLDAWPGPLVTDEPTYAPVRRRPQPWPGDRFVTADELAGVPDAIVYDARTAQRYAHGDPDVDPRPGHIPGAVSAPWADNLDEHHRFRSTTELRGRYADALQRPAIAYCGSGVTACHDLLALEIAGIQGTALYPGSWSQWGNDPARAAQVGIRPGPGPGPDDRTSLR